MGVLAGMASDPPMNSETQLSSHPDELEMPRATIAPLTLSLGLAMLAVGVITSPAFLIVGAAISDSCSRRRFGFSRFALLQVIPASPVPGEGR